MSKLFGAAMLQAWAAVKHTLNAIGSMNIKSIIFESSYDTCRRSDILALI